MKRIGFILCAIFMCAVACATTYTQYWYVENESPTQTSCTTGGDINLPTAPTKYGYDFIGWEQLLYVQIEYLESTGTQWIDTGIQPTIHTETRIKGQFLEINTNDFPTLAGCSQGENGVGSYRYYPLSTDKSQNKIRQTFGSQQFYQNFNTDIHNVIFNDTDHKVYVDNNLVGTLSANSFTVNNANLFLFGVNGTVNPGGLIWSAKGRIYHCKIFENNIVIRDFIPVLDNNNVPCMFDKVEGKFYYNQGTGQFIAGPVVTE